MASPEAGAEQRHGAVKMAARRRKLPIIPPPPPPDQPNQQPVEKMSVEEELSRLPPEVLRELKSLENSDKFMPGEVSGAVLCTYPRERRLVHAFSPTPLQSDYGGQPWNNIDLIKLFQTPNSGEGEL